MIDVSAAARAEEFVTIGLTLRKMKRKVSATQTMKRDGVTHGTAEILLNATDALYTGTIVRLPRVAVTLNPVEFATGPAWGRRVSGAVFASVTAGMMVVPGPNTSISANPTLPVEDEIDVTVNKRVEETSVGNETFVAVPSLLSEGTVIIVPSSNSCRGEGSSDRARILYRG